VFLCARSLYSIAPRHSAIVHRHSRFFDHFYPSQIVCVLRPSCATDDFVDCHTLGSASFHAIFAPDSMFSASRNCVISYGVNFMKTSHKLRIGAKIAVSRLTGRPHPFFVQYSLLNACNAKCVYCNSPFREDPQLDTQTHLKILAEFSRLGTARIKFLGGEPLLRNDLGILIQEVRRLGMRSAMVTSGMLIPKRLDVVKQLNEGY